MGIKYQTFASWVQKRRWARKQYPAAAVKALPFAPVTAGASRLVEAVAAPAVTKGTEGTESLIVHLPGGARVEVRDARQAVLAAELLQALASARSC